MTEAKTPYIGRRIPRVDALDKVTGSAKYGFDVELPGMLYGATLRSPLAHAKIVKIDTSKALKAPGVKAVVTGKDFPFTYGTAINDQPFLAIDRVRYIGEPVAAVAAETEIEAREAVEKIRVTYDELPAVFDAREAAAADAPLLHPDLGSYTRGGFKSVPGTNILVDYTYSLGDIETGFAEADEIFEDEFSAHTLSHAAMETHAGVAKYDQGGYTIWLSTDRPYVLYQELTQGLGIPMSKVRLIVPYVGGSYGGKSSLIAEAVAIALARFTKGRPVKVVFSREEEFAATGVRVAAFIKIKTGVKKDGTFIARKVDAIWDSGAYAANAIAVAIRGAQTIFGPYRIPNLKITSQLIYTNKEISRSFRGYGTTQATWASESQIDIIAEKLAIDPLQIRLKNCYVQGDKYINGQTIPNVELKEALLQASHEIKWEDTGRSISETRRRGKGIAATIKGTTTPNSATCFIKVDRDGSVNVLCSSPEIGCGQETVFTQIAADTIGVPLSSVSIANPDTDTTPFNSGCSSSRTTYHTGNAIRLAGEEVREKILALAGDFLETDPSRLNLIDGKVMEEGAGERTTIKTLIGKYANTQGGTIIGEAHFSTTGSPLLEASPGLQGMSSIFWMFAAHAAEVEVDTATGVVEVLKIAAGHDVGRAINPMGCEQQIEGSVIWGISNSLYEDLRMDKGRILNDSLADYKIATTQDTPQIVPILIEKDPLEGPLGVKGVGEPGVAATPAAINNAIFDAVGIRIKDLPITPEKVLAALKEKAPET